MGASDPAGGSPGPILVTGGTGALGSAVTERLLADGSRVAATWIVEEERDRLADSLAADASVELIEADLSGPEGAAEAVARAAPGGSLAGLVALVGGFSSGKRVHEEPADEFERMIELNLLTAYRTCRAALPALLEGGGGAIVLVGAKAALEPFSGAAGYIASKAGVIALARSLAAEYRGDGVRANAILPSVIDTPANREAMPDSDHDRWVDPAAIAGVISFLVSEDSSPTSGAAVPVYGRA